MRDLWEERKCTELNAGLGESQLPLCPAGSQLCPVGMSNKSSTSQPCFSACIVVTRPRSHLRLGTGMFKSHSFRSSAPNLQQ